MQNFSADLLEFEPLRELVGRYVGSPLGRAELEKLEPNTDRVVLENALADVAEAIAYQGASRQPQAAARGSAIGLRFNSIPDVSSALTILRIEGAVLEPKQILELARLIEEAGEVRAALNLAGEKYPRLAAQVAATADPRPLLRDVRGSGC